MSLTARKPPLKGPLLIAIAGALLGVMGATMGAHGIAVAISGIPWLVVGWQGVTRRFSRTMLVIATHDGRTRVLYSSDSETLEQLEHQVSQSIGRGQIPAANQELALVSVQSA